MHKRTRAAMRLSRGLLLGRAFYRLLHWGLGILSLGLIGMVLIGHVWLAITLAVACYGCNRALRALMTRSA